MKFKRIIAMLIIATLILANGKCHVQASENSVKVNVVSVNNKNKSYRVKVKIVNNTKKSIWYGEEFSLYKKTKGKWKKIRWNDNYAFNDSETIILSGYSKTKVFVLNKKAFDEKLKKNKRYMIKFKISGKNKKIKFKL